MSRIYLVTGAAGFLGSNICAQLLEKGEKVRALVLPNDKSVKYIPEEVEICLGDLCDVESLEKFFTIPEGMTSAIIHCASMVTVDPAYSEKLMAVNVTGTRNIITKCLAHPECEKWFMSAAQEQFRKLQWEQRSKKLENLNQMIQQRLLVLTVSLKRKLLRWSWTL